MSNNKLLAFLITMVLSATILVALYTIRILPYSENKAESFYEILPEEKNELDAKDIETNEAFNTNEKSTHFAGAYQEIKPPIDNVANTTNSTIATETTNNTIAIIENTKKEANKTNEQIEKNNQLLESLTANKPANNKNSSIYYSLVNRKHVYLPTPVYLCSTGGKIVITILVDTLGNVTNATYNSASNSTNQCLIENAITYAKKAKFTSAAEPEVQTGTITFLFQNKN